MRVRLRRAEPQTVRPRASDYLKERDQNELADDGDAKEFVDDQHKEIVSRLSLVT